MPKNNSDTTKNDTTSNDTIAIDEAQAEDFLQDESELPESETADIEYSINEDDDEKPSKSPGPNAERLHKLIARAGIASRREAEEIVAQGRVLVNGIPVREAGSKADPARDRISVDGQPLHVPTTTTVVLMHKPLGVVSTKKDPEGRTTVTHLLPEKLKHLHPIGRLDYDTSGLLFLTDDGSLTQLLTHPSHGVEKVYWARVRGTVTVQTLKTLEAGIYLQDGKTAPCKARVRAQTENNALIQITLREGRNRQVRRMLDAVGHQVRALRRVRVASFGLDELLPGQYRVLLAGEVHALRKAAETKTKSKPKTSAKPVRKPERDAIARTAEMSHSTSTRPTSTRSISARPTTASRAASGDFNSRPVAPARSPQSHSPQQRSPQQHSPQQAQAAQTQKSFARPRVAQNDFTTPLRGAERSAPRATKNDSKTSPRDAGKGSERFAARTSERSSQNQNGRFVARPSERASASPTSNRPAAPRLPSEQRAVSDKRSTSNERIASNERFSSSALTQRLERQRQGQREQQERPHPVAKRVARSFDQAPQSRKSGTAPFAQGASSAKSARQAKPTRPPKAARVFAAATAEAAKNARIAAERPKFSTKDAAKSATTSKPFFDKTAEAKTSDSRTSAPRENVSKTPATKANAAKTSANSGAKTDYSKPVARRGERPWGQKTRKRA